METQYYPAFDEFRELSKKGNVIPVYRQLCGYAYSCVRISEDFRYGLRISPGKR